MRVRLAIKKACVEALYFASTLIFFFPARRWLLSIFVGDIGQGTTVHGYVRFFDLGKCNIGTNSTINRGCYIDNRGGISIGSNVNISHDCRIYTMGHDIFHRDAPTHSRAVTIGDNAWLFPGVKIMPGVSIGRGAVVYPYSVVTKSVPDFTIVGGVPAKPLGTRPHEIAYVAAFPIHFTT